MTDGEREQIKLRANALDRASTACLTVGVLAPFAAALYTGGNLQNGTGLFWATMAYLGAAIVLHHAALNQLKELDE
jgi:hypothetical protein